MDRLAVTLVVLVLLTVGDGALLAQGPLVPAEIPGEVVYIPFPVDITPDGDLTDWAGIPAITARRLLEESPGGAEPEGFVFQLAADETTLYLAMTAAQPAHPDATLALYLNLTTDLATDLYRDGVIELIFSAADAGRFDPSALNITGVNSHTIVPHGVVFEIGRGWGLELAIPLTETFVRSDCAACEFPPPQNNAPFHGREIGLQAILSQLAPDPGEAMTRIGWAAAQPPTAGPPHPATFGRGLFFETGRTDIPQPSPTLPAPSFDIASVDWQAAIRAGWEGYTARFVMCGMACGINMGLVFDGDHDYRATSQHTAYGLLMAAVQGDQAMFDVMAEAARHWLLDPATGLHHQAVDAGGSVIVSKALTGAEADLAAALILAQSRVDSGQWEPRPGGGYGASAGQLIDTLYALTVSEGAFLQPGTAGGGDRAIHLAAFSPAWYRLFDRFQDTARWEPVIQLGYLALYSAPDAPRGTAPAWATVYGDPVPVPPAYQTTTPDPETFIPWRVALDCLWYATPSACAWAERAVESIASQATQPEPAVTGAGLFVARAAGEAVLEADLAGALAALQRMTASGLSWGDAPTDLEAQTMAWLGAALLAGDLRNPYTP